MEKDMHEETELKRILSDNIQNYLSLNHLQQKEAAEKAGLRTQTLNSWITKTSYPREENLKKLAAALNVTVEDLTVDMTEAGIRRRHYMSVREKELLQLYKEDGRFQNWVDLGMDACRQKRLDTYLDAYTELMRTSGYEPDRPDKQDKQDPT